MERLIPKSFFPLISSLSLSLPANGDCAARVGGGKDGSGTAMAAAVDRIRGGGEQRRVVGRGLRIGEEGVAGGCSGTAAAASRRGEGVRGSDGSGVDAVGERGSGSRGL